MKLTRRDFLKSLMLGTAAATVPLAVSAAPNAPTEIPQLYARINYQAIHVIGQALRGRKVQVVTSNMDKTRAEYQLVARRAFDVDMRMLTGSASPVSKRVAYRLNGQKNAALTIFEQPRNLRGASLGAVYMDETAAMPSW